MAWDSKKEIVNGLQIFAEYCEWCRNREGCCELLTNLAGYCEWFRNRDDY